MNPAPESASYPVAGAAVACGVDIGMAQRYCWANRVWLLSPSGTTRRAMEGAYSAIQRVYGDQTTAALQERLEAAIMEDRIYWPVPGWKEAMARQPDRPLPDVDRTDDDGVEPPEQPEPIE